MRQQDIAYEIRQVPANPNVMTTQTESYLVIQRFSDEDEQWVDFYTSGEPLDVVRDDMQMYKELNSRVKYRILSRTISVSDQEIP